MQILLSNKPESLSSYCMNSSNVPKTSSYLFSYHLLNYLPSFLMAGKGNFHGIDTSKMNNHLLKGMLYSKLSSKSLSFSIKNS